MATEQEKQFTFDGNIVSCGCNQPELCSKRSYSQSNIPNGVHADFLPNDNIRSIGICTEASTPKNRYACKYQPEGITVKNEGK